MMVDIQPFLGINTLLLLEENMFLANHDFYALVQEFWLALDMISKRFEKVSNSCS